MSDTTFTNAVTVTDAGWFNAINDFFYTVFSGQSDGTIAGASITMTGLTLTGALSVQGNATIGNGAGDSHTINGLVTAANGLSVTGNASADTGNFGTMSATNLVVGTSTPASATATGTTGTIAWDGSFIYVCVSTNTWERVAIASW